ncbi:MAG: adenylosuccinate lyase, partial [Thaumarchaeota archaeon]|nr:adenylosuccinate lyase [Nitrososphaerota archaeon]
MPEEKFGHDTYLSPFTWRYGSTEMRTIFSERHYRAIWRKIWTTLAAAQHDLGLITKEELNDIKKHSSEDYIDLKRAHEIEKEIGHDLMAELKTFAEQSKIGGGKLHLGATSADIEDNADIIRIQYALAIIRRRVIE